MIALYDFVTALRYVAVPARRELAPAPRRGQRPEEPLRRLQGQGEPLQHAAQAQGIAAHLVLVPRFGRPTTPSPGLGFNHAISRVRARRRRDLGRHHGRRRASACCRRAIPDAACWWSARSPPRSRSCRRRARPTIACASTGRGAAAGAPPRRPSRPRPRLRRLRAAPGRPRGGGRGGRRAGPRRGLPAAPRAPSRCARRRTRRHRASIARSSGGRGRWTGSSPRGRRAPGSCGRRSGSRANGRARCMPAARPLYLNDGYPLVLEEEIALRLPAGAAASRCPRRAKNGAAPLRYELGWTRPRGGPRPGAAAREADARASSPADDRRVPGPARAPARRARRPTRCRR